jgi:zinc D-Ala-D-Ala carboxypeptidase
MRWFQDAEFACTCPRPECVGKVIHIETALGDKLDALRTALGAPIVVNSGIRCADHNAEVGGAPDSAHLAGQAADLACTDPALRRLLVKMALTLFDYVEVAPHHVHVDVKNRGARLLGVGNG